MNKINPLYIVAFLAFIVLVLILRVGSMQENLNSLSYAVEQTRQVGRYSSEIKKEFGDKQKQVQIVKNFLKSNGFLQSPHIFNVSNSKIDIEIVNVNSKLANRVVGKILNTSLVVSHLEIKDVDFNKTIKIKIKF